MGSKRQLPAWMLRTAATDEVTNLVPVVNRKGNGSKKLPTKTCHPDSSVEVAEVKTCESEVTTKTNSCLVVKKSKTTRSRKKLVKQADDDGDNSSKYGREVEKENHAPPRRKRKAKVLNSLEESNLSEDELSVDDLISIAKEHINAEKKKERQQRSKSAVCESFKNKTTHKEYVNTKEKKEDQRSKPTECESFKSETTHKDSTPSGGIMSSVNTIEASSDLVECQPSEKDAISFSSTGVLTQDILELFLGPFVKKCSEVKPNPEMVSNSTKPDYTPSNQIQGGMEADPNTKTDFPSRNHTIQDGLEGDPVAPVKKKGSLKDMIALM